MGFEIKRAVRDSVPLHVGLVGPSGSGKTFSALRLATGMRRVAGGEIYVIDTEADRAKHYAPLGGEKADGVKTFDFLHLSLPAPFGPLRYLEAVETCARAGAKVIVVDSASHMHEGPGGTLESHEEECERLVKAWSRGSNQISRDKVNFAAWQRPKAELRQFLNTMLQLKINVIWCFRAKEKLKIKQGDQPKPLGFMPIAGDEMIYEMTVNCLLYPNSGGVPSWHSDELGERAIIKLTSQIEPLMPRSGPLSEETGEALARWASGGGGAAAPSPRDPAAVKLALDRVKMPAGQRAAFVADVIGREVKGLGALTAEEIEKILGSIKALETSPGAGGE